MGDQSVFVHSSAEIECFGKEYRAIIFKGFADAKLRRSDWEMVESLVLEKYALGKIEFNPTKISEPSKYYYIVARNCAKDEVRKQRFVELDEKGEAEICDRHDQFSMMEQDEKGVVQEAFRRLSKECPDTQKVEILLRYAVNGEERSELAEEYAVAEDFVSLVKTRWLPRLQKLVRKVMRDDMDGELEFSNTDIRFLEPYMLNW